MLAILGLAIPVLNLMCLTVELQPFAFPTVMRQSLGVPAGPSGGQRGGIRFDKAFTRTADQGL